MPDLDNLPPTQYLILEVLAARHRLGEAHWTFPVRVAASLRDLQAVGLISVMHGITEHTLRASLTDAGREHALSEGYVSPLTELLAEKERTDRQLFEARSVLDQAMRAGDRSTLVAAWVQRDEAIKQRDEARAEVKALTRDNLDAGRRIGESNDTIDQLLEAVAHIVALVNDDTSLPVLLHAVVELRRFRKPPATP